ncbi:MAG: UDP-N-acetylglucosamine--N-acetylmuramyl-(pentapeptide) pyrophosphoryl-undecaprenol N-acetylglucosamine transferase [Microbacteriaceae bacterium]
MTNYLLAGGGTAGHVNPLLALAQRIRAVEPEAMIFALGTAEGLEAKLVPERGFDLVTIERLPFPRKINGYALSFPIRFQRAVAQVAKLIVDESIDVVVGFGGYASAPAYEAAKRTKTPLVVHEANALPGLANIRAAKFADAVAVAFKPALKLKNAKLVGMPLRPEIEALLIDQDVLSARLHFGLQVDAPTLLVTGGSLGAKRINETIEQSRVALKAAGIQVLHIVGPRSELPEVDEPLYRRIGYCDRMDLAIAASTLAVARAGAATVSEFAAIGLPAIYVPYPVGNGEQALNAKDLCEAGGGVMVLDQDFTPETVLNAVIPLASSPKQLKQMRQAALEQGIGNGTERLFDLVTGVLKARPRRSV